MLGVHKNTVREWIKRGLATIDDRRPTFVLGSEVRAYLETRRASRKRPCGAGEIYCVRCREPRKPVGGMVDYLAITTTTGNLQGICPHCGSLMYRRLSRAKLAMVCSGLEVMFPQVQRPLGDCSWASLNSDLALEGRNR